jgi:hypothetical protein
LRVPEKQVASGHVQFLLGDEGDAQTSEAGGAAAGIDRRGYGGLEIDPAHVAGSGDAGGGDLGGDIQRFTPSTVELMVCDAVNPLKRKREGRQGEMDFD